MSEWKETTLSEIVQIIPGYAFKGKHFGDNGTLIVKIKDINPPYVVLRSAQKVDLTNYSTKNLDKYKLDKGQAVLAMTGATIGKIGILRETEEVYVNQRVAKIAEKDGFNYKFAIYSISGTDFQTFIQNNIDSNSAQENISATSIGRYPVLLPPPEEQRAIASVLSSLDDKIDLLHRQNQTLEQMAETLFRQWFVEEADEGWEVKKLRELVDIGIGRTPPRKEFQWFSKSISDVKWVSIKDLGDSGIFVLDTSEYLTEEAVEKFNIPIILPDTVLLSFKMTLGRVAITTEHMLSNEAIAHFKFNEETPFSKEFLYFYLKTYPYETLGSTSSIVTSINSGMIKDMEAIIPDDETLTKFENQVIDYFDKIKSNQTQIRTLTALRDTLLPKLMSGEIRIV